MDEQRKRAARVLAYLERRTEANGCTPAEAEQAREKAAKIRARYKVEPDRIESGDLDYLRPDPEDLFRDLVQASFVLYVHYLTRPRSKARRKRARAKRRAKAIRFRWRG